MIRTADLAEMVSAITRLRAHAVGPNIVLTRPGPATLAPLIGEPVGKR